MIVRRQNGAHTEMWVPLEGMPHPYGVQVSTLHIPRVPGYLLTPPGLRRRGDRRRVLQRPRLRRPEHRGPLCRRRWTSMAATAT